jgi:MAP/microtubule affinity-regulating kinase
LFDKYRLGKVLGEGANAVVRLLEPRSNTTAPHLAIKQFKEKLNWPTAKMEARILRELNHKNVIRIDKLYRKGDKVYLILEYFDAPNLSEVIRQRKGHCFDEATVCKIIKQLVEALAHCHQRGIYHLDVKPENILVDTNWKIKLIDFAFSVKMIDNSKIKKYCGTPSYMAPEILKKESYYPQKADSWSVGIVAFRLFTGKAPFKGTLSSLRKKGRGDPRENKRVHVGQKLGEKREQGVQRVPQQDDEKEPREQILNEGGTLALTQLLSLPFLKQCVL